MSFRLAIFKLSTKRLVVAGIAAVLTHLLLFSSGHFVLSNFSIPSDASRILMLTLDSSLLDGIQEQESEDAETLNDVEINTAKSVNQVPLPDEVIPNLDAEASPEVAKTTDQTPLPEEFVEALEEVVEVPEELAEAPEEVVEVVEAVEVPEEVAEVPEEAVEVPEELAEVPEEAVEVPEELAEGSLEELAEGSLEELAEGSLEKTAEGSLEKTVSLDEINPSLTAATAQQDTVLTSLESPVSIPQSAAAPESEVVVDQVAVTEVSVSKKQRRMLERKIAQFAKQIESGETSESVNWEHKGQAYVATFTRVPAADEMEMDKIEVEVVTEQDGRKLSKKMRMKKLAFSNFAQFVNQWDERVTMHDDELDGRFHSNSKIFLAPNREAAPMFFGKVTTASNRVDIDAHGKRGLKKNIFLGGLETGVKKIRMPEPKLLYTQEQLEENSKTFFYEQDTRIVFTVDGRYTAQSLDKSGRVQASTEIVIGDSPIYIYSARHSKLHVGGTVNGKVLLYSPKGIIIESSIMYADSGSIEPHDNFLGLVSDKDIVVADSKVTGPGDLQIDASIYAKREFKVKNYTDKHAGTLRIFGSLTAGTHSATEPRYATSIVFDKRIEDTRPPNYPVSDRYELALSERDWEVELNDESPATRNTPAQ